MVISFRTRLFVSATLIVGCVLLLVVGLGWSRILSFEVERLDERLCMEARRLLMPPKPGENFQRLQTDMMGKLRLSQAEQLMLRLEPREGQPGLQSEHWPAGLAIDSLDWRSVTSRQRPVAAGNCALASFESSGASWRAALHTASEGRSFVAADLAELKGDLQDALRNALTLVIPLALSLSALGALLLAALTMRPVNRLREAMLGVTQKALDQRLPSSGEDREFKELIAAYNAMLANLEQSFAQATRFSADAAHELKTPLTILQGRLEQAVNNAQDPLLQAELTGLQDEVARLANITRKLLLLSQADAGRLALKVSMLDLSAMLKELLADAEMLLSDQKLNSDIEPNLRTPGDALLLRQLFNNLLSNAVRYCRGAGTITVTARALPDGIECVFGNPCEAIAPESRAHFFDRFFRGDASRNRRTEGHGLGLSLAREIARAHGGELTLQASASDQVRIRLWLPKH